MRHTHYFFEIREGGFPLFTELPSRRVFPETLSPPRRILVGIL